LPRSPALAPCLFRAPFARTRATARLSSRHGKSLEIVAALTLLRRRLDAIPANTARDLRDRALIATLTYGFARIGAALKMRVEDLQSKGSGWLIRLHEKRRQAAHDAVPAATANELNYATGAYAGGQVTRYCKGIVSAAGGNDNRSRIGNGQGGRRLPGRSAMMPCR
jgi:hypothetical protein